MSKLVEYASEALNDVPQPQAASADLLSQREREVVALLARGYTNRQIADALVISMRTADGRVAHIFAKLGLSTRAQAGRVGGRAAARACTLLSASAQPDAPAGC